VRCEVELLVVTPDRSVAAWAAEPIRIGPSNPFRALVVGPDRLPCITDIEHARAQPELAVLSAMGHGQDANGIAVPAALAALAAVVGLDDARLLYSDLVWVALSDAARGSLEARMRSGGYEYESDFAPRYFAEGKRRAERWAERVLTASTLEDALR
jgi:hypothetical protein